VSAIKKILFFFDSKQRRTLSFIALAIIFSGLIEMVAVAAIFPFMAVLAKPSLITSSQHLNAIYQALHFSDLRYFIIFLGTLVISCLILGNAFSAFVAWITLNFCYRQGELMSSQLLRKYLAQPYSFFLFRHSSALARNLTTEIDRIVTGIFIGCLQSFAKVVVIACILLLLFAIEPKLALTIIAVLGGSYVLIYVFIKTKLARSGKIASLTNATRLQLIGEVMGAIKELKILQRENNFVERYQVCAHAYAKAETLSQLSLLFSRYAIEAIAFGGMLLITLYLIASGADISHFIPLLGLYALAGYRLMPAMQQLFSGFSMLRYYSATLDSVYQEMHLPSKEENLNHSSITFEHSLVLKKVGYCYPTAEKMVLNDINLSIQKNSIIGLVGSSGAGKTTLIDIFLGLLTPLQGTIEVDGVNISEHNLGSWQAQIGYVPQTIFLVDASVASNIALGIAEDDIDHDAVIRAATLANLHEFVEKELPQKYNTVVGERGVRLSGGQRQRIGIARALYHDPSILIFDEATSALDGVTEKVIMEAIKNLGHTKTIIIVAHRLNTVRDCDHLYVMSQGKIVGEGTFHELSSSNQEFQQLALLTQSGNTINQAQKE